MTTLDSFGSSGDLHVGSRSYKIFRLSALEKAGVAKLSRIPFSIKILLENLLRCEDNLTVKRSDFLASLLAGTSLAPKMASGEAKIDGKPDALLRFLALMTKPRANFPIVTPR